MHVSIVIPAYNAERTLAEAIESVLAQTHPHWEVIVVDDGSVDGTAAIARAYADRDARVQFLTQPNAGESGARNAGIARAQHDWLVFLDSDDWLAPEYLQRMTAAVAGDATLDAVHCRFARVAVDGTSVPEAWQAPSGDLFPIVARRAPFPPVVCMVRRAVVQRVGGFEVALRTCPDWDLWQKIARTGAHFGAVPEVLAYYRMSENSASLNAAQLFADGLVVLKRGHAPDPRVSNPAPAHAAGEPPDQVRTQVFYLMAWCAGTMIGADRDPEPLFELVREFDFPELQPDAIAQCLFDSAPLPARQPPREWPVLWPHLMERAREYLVRLEAQARAPGLASAAAAHLQRMALAQSPAWRAIIEERDHLDAMHREAQEALRALHDEMGTLRHAVAAFGDEQDRIRSDLEQERTQQGLLRNALDQARTEREAIAARLAETAAAQEALTVQLAETLAERDRMAALIEEVQNKAVSLADSLTEANTIVEQHAANLVASRQQVQEATAALNATRQSPEHRLGDLVLNRFHLRQPVLAAELALNATRRSLALTRLAGESGIASAEGPRVMATICDVFPIYSQTFVHEELAHMVEAGFDLRVVHSHDASSDLLRPRHAKLWPLRRRMRIDAAAHARDMARYRRRLPGKVDELLARLSAASGIMEGDLARHWCVQQAFTFTRMVEAYRPAYLHSYFFYDRSLMALVAGFLLDIPRGMSCYADHQLDDFELKVVPLHLALCDVVVATSERIKRELLARAPGADPARILVKPNGVDTDTFRVLSRTEPAAGEPHRLVSVSRIEPKKGLVELVDAIAELRRRGIAIEAHLLGEADEWSPASREYKARLDERITSHGLWGTVHLEGRQDLAGVLRFLGASHAFVAPYVETDTGDKDGVPTALLEAMATGLPVVATDAGSIPEVVRDGVEGAIVPQRNVMLLADAIESMLREALVREQRGLAAAARVRGAYDAALGERVLHDRIRAVIASRQKPDESGPTRPAAGRT